MKSVVTIILFLVFSAASRCSPHPEPGLPSSSPSLTQSSVTLTEPGETLPAPSDTSTPEASPAQGSIDLQASTSAGVSNTPGSSCFAPSDVLPELTEGPFYRSGSPENTNLAGDLPGMHLSLSGYVLNTNCQPVAHAWLDFWQADSSGQYDNSGYTLRGHQYTDENGAYTLETVIPGLYPGRTEHIHFKIQAPDGPLLTSQLFFPGVAENEADRIFDERLIIKVMTESKDKVTAVYNFIVPAK